MSVYCITTGDNSPIIIGNNNKVKGTPKARKMTRKEAFLTKSEKSDGLISFPPPIDYRAPKENYIENYTEDQLNYLFRHGYLEEYHKTGARWENPYATYWQFTDKGKRWRIWYTTDMGTLLRVYVFRFWWFRELFRKH